MENKNAHITKHLKNDYLRRCSRNRAILFGVGAVSALKCTLCVGYFGIILTTSAAFLGYVRTVDISGYEGNKCSIEYFFPSIVFGSLTILSVSGLGFFTIKFGKKFLYNLKEFRKYNNYCRKYTNDIR